MSNADFDLKAWQKAYEATPEEIRQAILNYLHWDVSHTRTPGVQVSSLKNAIEKATGFYCPKEICLLFCRELGIPFKADGMVGVSKSDIKEALNSPKKENWKPELYDQWKGTWPVR